MIDLLGYIGAALLCVAPFIVLRFPIFYVYSVMIGLLIITPQAYDRELWNLVALNLSGAIGYGWNLYDAKTSKAENL